MAWVSIAPGYETIFRQHGLDSASSFLSWAGILVNYHRHRQVEAVALGSPSLDQHFYLKKEFAVSWRDRFRNAWHGFGWCSTVVREAKLLHALKRAGIGCPDVVAHGEDQQQAFMVLRDASGMTELRAFLHTAASTEARHRLAVALGRELARLHDAGFHHPDLVAKHVLVAQQNDTFRFCFLDWQRGQRRRRVPWRLRCRDLAVLDATLKDVLASNRLRLRCLRAYCRAMIPQNAVPFGRLAYRIRRQAESLRQKRNIREIAQLPVPPAQQQFVPLPDGQLLVAAHAVRLRQVRTGGTPEPRWELPRLAHVLFRLHRFGIPAPRLIAVGNGAGPILTTSPEPTIPWHEAFTQASLRERTRLLAQAGWIVRQVHEAGYRLPVEESWLRRLRVQPVTTQVIFAHVEPIQDTPADWRLLARMELPAQEFPGSRSDRLRFLRGYLQQAFRNPQEHSWIKSLLSHDTPRRKRQAIS